MSGALKTVLEIFKKLSYFVIEYAYVLYLFLMKFIKIQMKKWGKCTSHKKMEKAYGALGSEIYGLHKQHQDQWNEAPSVQQHLKAVEEAESKVFQVDADIEDINSAYMEQKEEIKTRYAAKRADVGTEEPEGPDY